MYGDFLQVDPLTGEGIHTAMIAGKIAAQCAQEMHTHANFSLSACRAYELRCFDTFVHEFTYSAWAAKAIARCPLLLDAVAVVGKRRGQAFLDFFGEVMTGVRPKSAFFEDPLLLVQLAAETVRQVVLQYVLRTPSLVPKDIGQVVVDKFAK